MLPEVLKFRLLLLAATFPPLLVMVFFAIGAWHRHRSEPGPNLFATDSAGSRSLEKMKEALAKDRDLLDYYEREQTALRAEVIKRRKLFQQGQVDKVQVVAAEKSFVAALKRLHEMRHSVDETEIAITEFVLGEKVLRLAALPGSGLSQTAELARFNGGLKWSLREAPRLEKYFSQAFGRRLPVTALGQTGIHNRLGFDHHDAMDVALHPDSTEGKALISHLRKTGIPFIAFRGAVMGVSTGPHIHIGKPSGRLPRW